MLDRGPKNPKVRHQGCALAQAVRWLSPTEGIGSHGARRGVPIIMTSAGSRPRSVPSSLRLRMTPVSGLNRRNATSVPSVLLQDRLDLESDLDLVADHHAAAVEWHVELDPEVGPADLGSG